MNIDPKARVYKELQTISTDVLIGIELLNFEEQVTACFDAGYQDDIDAIKDSKDNYAGKLMKYQVCSYLI
ncbi:MAG: hypothetical protein GX366_09485 [Epulopiscium sp.]|nr:hypothetical protein [Candidatus Epulonipiscium sp.]